MNIFSSSQRLDEETISWIDQRIKEKFDEIREIVRGKNKSYGGSVFVPIEVFCHDRKPADIICTRIDDKLCRIKADQNAYNEDSIAALIGYLVLLDLAKKLEFQGIKIELQEP